MQQEIVKILIQSGGAVGALFFVWKILELVYEYRNGNGMKDIEERMDKLESNEVEHLRTRINSLEERMRKVERELSSIKTTVKNIKESI